MRALYLTLVLLTIATSAFAQQEARSAKKGASDPLPITGTVVDADHNALDVYIKGGAAGGGGSGDASLAEQQTQTGILTTIDADTGNIATSTALIDDAIATTGSAITTKGMAASGTDGTNARVLKTDTNGELQIDVLTLPTLPAGTNAIGKLSANSGVDIGDVDVTSVVPGTTATSLGKAEDAGHSSGDTGVMILCVRSATLADKSAGATSTAYGIALATGSGHKIYNNIVNGQGAQAVKLTGGVQVFGPTTAPLIYNNTFYDATTGVELGDSGVSAAEVKNNIFETISTPISDSGTSTVKSTNFCDSAGTGCSVTGSPSFTNAAAGDFTLQSGSNCRDVGLDLSATLTTDYIGTSRPQNGLFDIGALEYIVSIGGGGSTGNLGKGSKGLMGGM